MQQQPDIKIAFKITYYATVPVRYYLSATLNRDGTYTISETNEIAYINDLPENWQDTKVKFSRNTKYMGVFRSAAQSWQFSNEARAMLQYVFYNYGVQALVQLELYRRIDTDSFVGANDWGRYELVYASDLNFQMFDDDLKNKLFKISTLDGGLYERVKAYGDTSFNVPYFTNANTIDADAIVVKHEGIKLQWGARWISGATESNIITQGIGASYDRYVPAMAQNINIPFIGNDLLEKLLVTDSVTPDLFTYTVNYNNFSNNNYILKSYLPTTSLSVHAIFEVTSFEVPNPPYPQTYRLSLALVRIQNGDIEGDSTEVAYTIINNSPGTPAGYPITVLNPTFTYPDTVHTIYPESVYVPVIKWGKTGHPTFSATGYVSFKKLEIYLYSNDDITDLRFPSSPILGYRADTIVKKLTALLTANKVNPTTGFNENNVFSPNYIQPYSAYSEFLTTTPETLPRDQFFDTNAYSTVFTSGNAIRLTRGYPYYTSTLNSFLKSLWAMYGCSMGIDKDESGRDRLRVERVDYFFNKDLLLYDLGSDVSNFKITPLTELLGNTINAGFPTKWQDYSNYMGTKVELYGFDVFSIQQEYKLPFTKVKNNIDYVADVVADMYAIEQARANQNESNNSSPSNNNQSYVIEIEDESAGTLTYYNPDRTTFSTSYYKPYTYPGASKPASPFVNPSVTGLVYPDTALNLGLTAKKNILRNGKYFYSLLYPNTNQILQFQKQYWQMYNGNVDLNAGGIQTNLGGFPFGVCKEVSDIILPDLGATSLFKPFMFEVECNAPINLYYLMNSEDKYGYIQFTWVNKNFKNVVVKGFIWDVEQNIAKDSVTKFTLIAHPDFDYSQLD